MWVYFSSLTGIAFNYIIRADPLAPGCNPYPKDAQTPQPESKVAHDSIADQVSRLAQIRSAVEALPSLAPAFKRRRLAPAPDAFEGVTQLPSIPNVPIGMQALAHMNLQSGHSAVPHTSCSQFTSKSQCTSSTSPSPFGSKEKTCKSFLLLFVFNDCSGLKK